MNPNFVEAAAADDTHVAKSRVVENGARVSAERIEIAAVETDGRDPPSGRVHFLGDGDGVGDAATRVVRVDEERHGRGRRGHEGAKCACFVGEYFDERMSHRAARRDPELFAREDIARALEAREPRRARNDETAFDSGRPPETEIHERFSAPRSRNGPPSSRRGSRK